MNRRYLSGRLALRRLCSPAPLPPPPPHAEPAHHRPDGVQLERLDRGLVAATTSQGVFLSWRLLGDEVTGHTATGMAGPDFHVYRDGRRIATVTDSTNYLDTAGTATPRTASRPSAWRAVAARESRRGRKRYYDLPLRKPADGVTPAGEAYTYSANDMSVGDVDGDGQYEYIVKWDPSNSKDVSQIGYTGPVFIDTYRLDGTLLHRIDLGVNIRAGAHYTQFLVYDFDGDGRAEMMFKTAPGTKIMRYDRHGNVESEKFITMPEEDVRAGFSHTDDYRLSAAGLPRAPGEDVPRLARPPGGRGRALAGDAGAGVRHRAATTPIRCRERTPRRWSTTSSTCTRPAAAPATCCGSSRASSSTGRST